MIEKVQIGVEYYILDIIQFSLNIHTQMTTTEKKNIALKLFELFFECTKYVEYEKQYQSFCELSFKKLLVVWRK